MATRIVEGYKVVLVTKEDTLISAIYHKCEDEYGVEYIALQWVKPKKGCGPLCVFKTLEDALNFCAFESKIGGLHLRVYKCVYRKSSQEFVFTHEDLLRHGGVKFKSVRYLSVGAVLASSVMITNPVKEK